MDIDKEDANILKNRIFKASQRDVDYLTRFNKASNNYNHFTPMILNSLVQVLVVSLLTN